MTESSGERTGGFRHNRCDLALWFGASTTQLPTVVNVVKDICELMAVEKTEGYEITLAVNEAVANSIEHAFHNDPEKQVRVQFSLDDSSFRCTIGEENAVVVGTVLEMESMPIDEFSKSDGEKGVGLTLMRLYMDNVERVRTERGFEWLLTRRLRGDAMAERRDT